MAETVKVRTLRRIEDPQMGGVTIKANVTLDLPKPIAEQLIAEGKAEKANVEQPDRQRPEADI